MANKTVDDFLMNAKRVMFINPEDNNGIAAVFVIFEDVNIGIALYTEVVRVNETSPQIIGFKKSHSSIIFSFILEKTNSPHAKMLLDYDEDEFREFTEKVKPTDSYVLLFGGIEDGQRKIGGFRESPLMFHQYILE